MVDDSWLMAHGSCLKARGSRLMAHPIFVGHEPWATSFEAWAMSLELTINNRFINELFDYILYVLGIQNFQSFRHSKFQIFKNPKCQGFKVSRFQDSKNPNMKSNKKTNVRFFLECTSKANTPKWSRIFLWSFRAHLFLVLTIQEPKMIKQHELQIIGNPSNTKN